MKRVEDTRLSHRGEYIPSNTSNIITILFVEPWQDIADASGWCPDVLEPQYASNSQSEVELGARPRQPGQISLAGVVDELPLSF
jgi:hypothetical protein